jgi:hypothetical protein
VEILAGIFVAALLQDLSYTSKTVLVNRGQKTLAVAADISAMVTSSLYLILTASVTMRSGLSVATVEAFAAIAAGGACGTLGGMFAMEWLERRLAMSTAVAVNSLSFASKSGGVDGNRITRYFNPRFADLKGRSGDRKVVQLAGTHYREPCGRSWRVAAASARALSASNPATARSRAAVAATGSPPARATRPSARSQHGPRMARPGT